MNIYIKYYLLLILLIISGCGGNSDFTPVMAPVKDTEIEASQYLNWNPTPDQVDDLKRIKDNFTGSLDKLLDSNKWVGNRLRMTGTKDGLHITESIGSWSISLIPSTERNIVEIKGLLFAKNIEVKLDLDKNILVIGGSDLVGEPLSGKSPMFKNLDFKGMKFSSQSGPVIGYATILVLEDGSVAMDFYKVFIDGNKVGEYGILYRS